MKIRNNVSGRISHFSPEVAQFFIDSMLGQQVVTPEPTPHVPRWHVAQNNDSSFYIAVTCDGCGSKDRFPHPTRLPFSATVHGSTCPQGVYDEWLLHQPLPPAEREAAAERVRIERSKREQAASTNTWSAADVLRVTGRLPDVPNVPE